MTPIIAVLLQVAALLATATLPPITTTVAGKHPARAEVRRLHAVALERAAHPRASRTERRPPLTRPAAIPAIWRRLVACEAPGRGWRYGAPTIGIDPGYPFEGGPNFTPATWHAYAPPGYPAHAYNATPAQQLLVARRVLADQGPHAWPVCAPRVGLTRHNGLTTGEAP